MSVRYAPPGDFTSEAHSGPAILLAGASDTSVQSTGWLIRSVAVTNPTPFLVHFPGQNDAWVPPFTFNAIVSLSNPSYVVPVTSRDVPAGYPASPSTTLLATLTPYEAALAPSGGTPYPPNVRATAFAILSRPGPATYVFNVPRQESARGIILYVSTAGIAGNIIVSVWDFDDITGQVATGAILTSLALTANPAMTPLRIYPGVTVQANVNISEIVGETPQIRVVSSQTDSWGVDYDLIP